MAGKRKRQLTASNKKTDKRIPHEKKKSIVAVVSKTKQQSKHAGVVPNSVPFKKDLLKEIQRSRFRQVQIKQDPNRNVSLNEGVEPKDLIMETSGLESLVHQAAKDREQFASKQQDDCEEEDSNSQDRKDNDVLPGQSSRRAYLRELKKVVDAADVLLQVLDARDPLGSRISSSMEDRILSRSDKKMVLVLNKIDLVPKDVVGEWLTYLRRSHPALAVKASRDFSSYEEDARSKANSNNNNFADNSHTPVGMEGLLQLLKNYARTSDAKSKTTIVVGIIGYPNTGKSSIINALKRTRAVGVSPRPGFTTSMQEIWLDRNVRLLDSPGVVFDDKSAMLGNCVDADSIEDPIPAIELLLSRCNPKSLLTTYNIPAFPPGNVMMFLAMVARVYGRVLKGGIPDKVGAARAVLRDWNSGKIPYYTPAPTTIHNVSPEDVKIVRSFGDAFDVNAYDKEVLGSLKDTSQIDFVRMDENIQMEGDACSLDLSEPSDDDASNCMEEDHS
jgi:nuclear GTP-binding protein